jgi:Ni/Co efflux regulator RcnB
MKILKLAAAAALALSGLPMASAPAAATASTASADQRGDRWEGNNDRRHNGWRNNRGRHNGWRNGRRHHAGRYRACRTVWRYGHRQRVCRWRYR